ncbi:MAG: dipeptidase [Gemmatimonadales bacterium]|nr:dipeptidase [Gemmatimonadales bacterium]
MLLPLLAMTLAAAPPPPPDDAALLRRARAILREAPLVDGHNDLPWAIRESKTAPMDVDAYDLRTRTAGHTDLARLEAGGVGVQFWSIYVPGEYRDSGYAKVQLEQFDIARRVIARYPDRLQFAGSVEEIRRARRAGKIASLLGMEGGHVLENSLGALRAYYDLGARYLTLTHNVTLDWADAATGQRRHGGLTPFGREVVREMNRLGMLVDLSHVSPEVMHQALDASAAPVIFSHSSARALVDHPRNVPDSVLGRMPSNGGVVMVTFVPSFISRDVLQWERGDSAYKASHPRPRATVKDVADHIEHVRKVAGVDHVGIGGDFDGIPAGPEGLEDVSSYPNLFAELLRRGWSDDDLRKLAGRNVLRAFEQAEAVSRRLRAGR